MTITEMQDRIEIRELTDIFANLADTKEVEKQVELFAEDGLLEFQMGFDGEIHEIRGRATLLEAFRSTVCPAKKVYHLNGQQTLTRYSETEAEGIAYCQATLVNEVDGLDIAATNYVRYTDGVPRGEEHRLCVLLLRRGVQYGPRRGGGMRTDGRGEAQYSLSCHSVGQCVF